MNAKKFIFATNNPGKLREALEILGPGFELATPASVGITEDIPETGLTLAENSLQKASYVWDRCGLPCFADDSGLEVDMLGGEPGVHTARYGGKPHDSDANIDRLLREMAAREEEAAAGPSPRQARTARFHTVVTLILEDGIPRQFEGFMDGAIARERHGSGGFGYDPVFRPAESGGVLTAAELPEDEKNAISHRGKALRAMAQWLKKR